MADAIDTFQADSIWETAYDQGFGDMAIWCAVTAYSPDDPGDGWENPPEAGEFMYRIEDEDGNELDIELDDADEAALLKEYEAFREYHDGQDRADALGVFDREW